MRSLIGRPLTALSLAISLFALTPRASGEFLSVLIGPPAQSLSASSAFPAPAYTITGSNWSYTPTGNAPPSSLVTVTADPDFLGNAGFEFQGSFHDDRGGGDSDALIQYQLALSPQSIAAGLYFTDVHLESDVTIVNGSNTNTGNIAIVETVRDQNGNLIGTLTNFDIWTAAGQSFLKESTLFLDPTKHYTVLNISKDILMSSDTGNAVPQVSHIDQSYSVPEPSSLALIGLGTTTGLLGCSFRRRMLRESARAASPS